MGVDKLDNSDETALVGCVRGVAIEVTAGHVMDAAVDLVIAAMFAREMPGTKLSGSILKLDEAMSGALGALRKDRIFLGDVGETLTLYSPPGPIRADALLLIGFGRPERWTLDIARTVASDAVRQALVRGARSAGFAPGLLDSGLSRKAIAGAPAAMMRGVLLALQNEPGVDEDKNSPLMLERWVFEKGSSRMEDAIASFRQAFPSSP